MPVVRLGASRQVTIPKGIHDELGLSPGDYLEVEIQEGKVVYTPKTFVDKRIDEGLRDIAEGRVHGPFSSAEDAVRSLRGPKKAGKS